MLALAPLALITFPIAIDVKLDLVEKTHWQGIRDGCYAPAENFDPTLHITIDGDTGKVKQGTATIMPQSHGATSGFGDKGSFVQRMTPGPWELQTEYPAGCGDDPAPEPPGWALSPKCDPVKERLSALLVANSVGAEAGGDGSLMLNRYPKKKLVAKSKNMGARCYRTLHDIETDGLDSEIAILPWSTLIQIPVPGLKPKLLKLARGTGSETPSFTVRIDVSGDCRDMRMKPALGSKDDFQPAPFSQAHQALGPFNGEPGRSTCTIEGDGRAIISRSGAVQRIGVR